jgi:hypothetical protein
MKEFFRGMGAINLFPSEREENLSVSFPPILSDQEAMQKDWETVGQDMWYAIEKVKENEKF